MKSGIKTKFQIKSFGFLQIGLYAFLICIIYGSSLRWLVIHDWKGEGYSHGYLILILLIDCEYKNAFFLNDISNWYLTYADMDVKEFGNE